MRNSLTILIAMSSLALTGMSSAYADDPLDAIRQFGPGGIQRPVGAPPLPGRPGARILRRQPSADSTPSIISGSSEGGSIITGDDSTLLHPKPQGSLGRADRPITLPNGAVLNPGPDSSKTVLMPDGSNIFMKKDGSVSGTRPDGSSFTREADGARTFITPEGKFGQISPDGTGPRPDGSMFSKNDVDGSMTLSKDGYKLTRKQDGSMVFTRSNGLETEFKDGHIRMKQDGQYTGRELK